MPQSLKGKILLVKSRSQEAAKDKILSVIASVNRALDDLTQPNEERRIEQHQMIAEAAAAAPLDRNYVIMINERKQEFDMKMEAQNVLSGAIIIGNLPLVMSLLTRDSPVLADVNTESPYFGRPLQLAAAWGHLQIVRYLLDCGADPHDAEIGGNSNYWDPSGELRLWDRHVYQSSVGSALRAAVLGGHEEIARLLLKPEYRLSPSNTEYLRAFLAAARGGHIHLIHLLLQITGKSLSEFKELGEEMLWEAVRHNQGDVVQMLLDNGVNVNAAPYPSCRIYGCALGIAASQGYERMVRLLLDCGADVNLEVTPHGHPIEGAARGGHEEVVELLLEHGASPERAFVRAADGGQWRLIRRLLDKEVNFHAKKGIYEGTIGMEALQKAIIVKNPTVISMLVDAGVPLNDSFPTPDGLPMVLAKTCAAEWIVDLLLSLGAEDREIDLHYRSNNYSEDRYDEQMERGGVRITKRTWEWVGKY